jgi:hypothetical protein
VVADLYLRAAEQRWVYDEGRAQGAAARALEACDERVAVGGRKLDGCADLRLLDARTPVDDLAEVACDRGQQLDALPLEQQHEQRPHLRGLVRERRIQRVAAMLERNAWVAEHRDGSRTDRLTKPLERRAKALDLRGIAREVDERLGVPAAGRAGECH